MDRISVVVPIYKVEAEINRCVKSIVEQSYTDLQIILVDDGSPDRCPEICDEWAKSDSRITVIHKENGGQSDARNAGMGIATGKYIAFVDGDDWIEPDMYAEMYRCMIETGSDIVSCGAVRDWEGVRAAKPMMRYEEDTVLTRREAMKALIESTYIIQTVWNKLYAIDKVKDIPFEVDKTYEDEFWTWKAIAQADKVSTLGANYYHYIQRPDSIIGKGYTEKALQVIEAKEERNAFIQNQMPELTDLSSVDLLYTCYYHGCQIIKHRGSNIGEKLKSLSEACKKCKVSKAYLKKQTLKKRLRILAIRNALPLICRIDVYMGIS